MMMSMLAAQTKIANGTKRAAGASAHDAPSFPPNCEGVHSLRSEANKMLWKWAAMAKQTIVQRRTATE